MQRITQAITATLPSKEEGAIFQGLDKVMSLQLIAFIFFQFTPKEQNLCI